jgi:hypothetical protein
MVQFTDEDKEVKEFNNNYFEFGVHKVQIDGVFGDTTEAGKEFIEVGVIDPQNQEKSDKVRLWFTTPQGNNISFNTLRTIYVHNAPESAKDDARKSFDELKDTTEMAMLLNKVIGGEAWITVYPDPTRTYTGKDGQIRKSINKNIFGFQPKERPELLPQHSDSEPVNAADYPDEPFGSTAEEKAKRDAAAKNTVPKKW